MTIGTHYLFGVTILMFLAIPDPYPWTGVQPASMPFEEFVTMGGPVALLGMALYLYAQRWLCHPPADRGLHQPHPLPFPAVFHETRRASTRSWCP